MRLIRFRAGDRRARVGVLDGDAVTELAAAGSLGDLLALPLDRIRAACEHPGGATRPGRRRANCSPRWTAAWRCGRPGVTYERSRTARMAESEQSADVYDRVYAAERPELFFKSAAWRVSGPGEPVSVRSDSVIDVPEPELAVVLNAAGDVAGYTICNDMSSRSIEGENPLYLPQAKIYLGGCAVGPWIVPGLGGSRPVRADHRADDRPGRRGGLGGQREHRGAAQEDRRAGRLPVPRGRVPGRGDPVHRDQPGARPALHPGGGRRGPHRRSPGSASWSTRWCAARPPC